MSSLEAIKNIEDLLKNVVDVSKITKTEITRLTATGDNYGSLMLKLEVTLRSDENENEVLHLVAKKIPTNEIFRKSFNVQVTFKKEVAMYEIIIPILQEFQRKNGVTDAFDCIPKFYAARCNLHGGNEVDEDAVIILENLGAKGYANVKRQENFNLESAKCILKDLAEFHAIPLAIKLKQPDIFEDKLKKYCQEFIFDKELHKLFWDTTKSIIKENKNCASVVEKINFISQIRRPKVSEPFGTLTHADLWSNNTMQIFAPRQIATKNKFLDFQFLAYGSPASDVFFFIFTSVQLEVLKKYLDDLIQHYHKHFVDTLKKLDCDITDFNLERFIDEIKEQSVFEIGHTLHFVLFVVNAQKIEKEFKFPDDIDKLFKSITPKAKEKVWYIVEECKRRGWI